MFTVNKGSKWGYLILTAYVLMVKPTFFEEAFCDFYLSTKHSKHLVFLNTSTSLHALLLSTYVYWLNYPEL